MSFFGGLKRMVQGKPVFEDPNQTSSSPSQPNAVSGQIQQQANQPKVLPEVVIERFEYDEDGDDISYDFAIQNNSAVTIELDKIALFNTHHDINDHLRSGEEREFSVYSGDKPTNNPVTYCELTYKDQSGDYFKSVHYIETEKRPEGWYRIRRIKFLPPVRDI